MLRRGIVAVGILAVVASAAYPARPERWTPDPELPTRSLIETRSLHLEEQADGVLLARDGSTGERIRSWEEGSGGFVRGALRPLRRERMRAGASEGEPFLLTRWSDGTLTLSDPASGVELEIAAFGRTSMEAFGTLLPP